MKNQFIIKRFMKKKAVKAVIVYPDKRIKMFWAIPKDNTLTIGEKAYLCDASIHPFYLMNNIPTFTYKHDNIVPIDMESLANDTNEITSSALKALINNKIIKDMYDEMNGSNMNLGMILSIVSVAAVIIVGFLLYSKIQDLENIITNLTTLIEGVS